MASPWCTTSTCTKGSKAFLGRTDKAFDTYSNKEIILLCIENFNQRKSSLACIISVTNTIFITLLR